jgi:hypothetical protein
MQIFLKFWPWFLRFQLDRVQNTLFIQSTTHIQICTVFSGMFVIFPLSGPASNEFIKPQIFLIDFVPPRAGSYLHGILKTQYE